LASKTKVVITVDDFGPRSEVNERAFILFRENLATRVSAIVNIPWPAQTAERLKQENIPVGLHLNISSGKALAPKMEVPSLIDKEGHFLAENKSGNLSHIGSADIVREFRAQLDYFHATGLTLSHLDNHRPEIYFFPRLLDFALNLAKEENTSFRHPLRNFSSEDIKDLARKYQCNEKDIIQLKAHYDDAVQKKGLSCPDYFVSDGSCGSFEYALEEISKRRIAGYCEIAVHLEGDKGKSNFDFMLSESFKAWNQHFHIVKPSEWRTLSRGS